MEAITGWDFADGAWLGAPSGVITADNRIKPAYRVLEDLIHREWRTACDVVTDENGCAEVNGFKGDYVLTDGVRKAAFHLGGETRVEVTAQQAR